ncbi:cytochrome c [Pontibacter ummariensis]|uniref:Cytochrome c n=2 Tax=Pontibacter ummariensis TaxID=1610492 RepID=A0A239C0U0_9BACT|nr:cytochrome c [Pontibacter ummariensis]SNS13935.1 cytochrome c [Pontibacter ummariensis]
MFASCVAFLAACGNSESEYADVYDREAAETEAVEEVTPIQTEDADAVATPSDVAQEQNYEEGKKLIALSDCLTCHQENQKLVGPSYAEVAGKYEFNEENVTLLANKIIQGGKGVWGEIPMTPHPDLNEEEAKAMARYILALKK